MAEPVSRSAYAAHKGVSRAAVTRWVQAGKLAGAALVDGGVDVEEADRQLAGRRTPNRMAAAPVPDDRRARAMSDLAVAMEDSFFPMAAAALSLSQTQREALPRCWLGWRQRLATGR